MPIVPNIPLTDYTQYDCRVLMNGNPLPASFELKSLSVKTAYQHITSTEIVFKQIPGLGGDAETMALLELGIDGMPLKVEAVKDLDTITLFDGLVARTKFTMTSAGVRLAVTGKTAAVRLSLNRKTETYTGLNDKEMIEQIISNNGCEADLSGVAQQLMVIHKQFTKTGTTDWDFLNMRAEANGCYVYTEGNKIILHDPAAPATPDARLGIVQGDFFSLNLEQDERKYRHKEHINSLDLSSLEAEQEAEDADADVPGKFPQGNIEHARYGFWNQMETGAVLNGITRRKKYSRRNGVVHLRPQLKAMPGFWLSISGMNDLVDGDYPVTGVLQEFSEGSFSTHLQFGLSNLSYGEKFNIAQAPDHPVLMSAIVIQLDDDPDGIYRIKVKPSNWADAQEPIWARMATMYAGDGYGMMMYPEIDDEVVIGFFGHDLRYPVILGSMFSPNKPPASVPEDENYKKVWISRNGMKWTWDDEKLVHEISTPAGNTIILSEDSRKVSIADQNGNEIELNDQEIKISASMDVKISAGANLDLKGTMVKIESDGILMIKGANVMIN